MNTSKWRRAEIETKPNNDRESEQSVSPYSQLETEKKKSAKGDKILEKMKEQSD